MMFPPAATWTRAVGLRGHFIVYTEEILVEDVAKIYVKEIFVGHGVLSKIILDRDLRFIAVF